MQIKHNRPSLSLPENDCIAEVIQSGFVAYGKEGKLFENELCNFLDLPEGHCVLVSSGSAALYVTLASLGVKGKTVAIPSYVCSSLRNAVALAGGIEAVIDTDINYPNIHIQALNQLKPDFAIIPHMFGIPVDLDTIDPNITVIEDCAQAIGSSYKTKKVGAIGKAAIFSFYATKLLTTGEGGAIVSTDKQLIDKVRDFIDFDCRNDRTIRFNFHLSDINAALGRSQLKQLPSFLQKREEIFQRYKQAGLQLVEPNNSFCTPVRYRAVLRVQEPLVLKEKLAARHIQTIIPIEEKELLESTPNAITFSRHTLSLPCYPFLQPDEVAYIIRMLEDIC